MRALAVALALACLAAVPNTPEWADDADVVEHLGTKLPLDLPFRDSTGERVTLRSYFDGTHPVYLILAYYECPQLCSLVLDAARSAMQQLDRWGWHDGEQFRALTISFDATEGTDQAARKKRMMAASWPFLVGDAASIEALTQRLGFHFLRDAKTGAIAHAAVTFAIAPDGTISRYLYGIDVPPRDLRLALLEASDGKTGSIGDKILLRCFHYDAATHRYGLFVARFMQIGGALIFLVAITVIASFARRRR
ncbi:MAG TPA: SCO family protein [Kofleriaceae bacterium]|nr:SCO family protein [Kofleriaceae bacterium]